MHHVRHGFITLLGLVVSLGAAECPYPCWSEIAADQFTYESFEHVSIPAVSPPYEFSLPYPSQLKGASSAECEAHENPNVDLYRYNPDDRSWTGPLSGPIYRNPSFIQVSALTHGWKGIAVHAAFEGQVDGFNGHTLIESVFFHTDRCYRAATEFGFSHYVKGLAGPDKIFFYYEINANCKPEGKCRIHGSGDALSDERVNIPVAIPAQPNSHGGSDWLYEAILVDGGAKWRIRVVDPYKHVAKIAPIEHQVQDFFRTIAKDYAAEGGTGYVTATATRDGALVYSGAPPAMNILKIYAAK